MSDSDLLLGESDEELDWGEDALEAGENADGPEQGGEAAGAAAEGEIAPASPVQPAAAQPAAAQPAAAQPRRGMWRPRADPTRDAREGRRDRDRRRAQKAVWQRLWRVQGKNIRKGPHSLACRTCNDDNCPGSRGSRCTTKHRDIICSR